MGALIEVAAGFHPDLTGRENIYLQGAIMGMKRHEIGRKLEQIVEFAGVGDFVDTPVKRYSSGMNARLGFSIAAHIDPEVLIIDEVLSVGDMAFQQRCVDRMREFKKQGVTIVFVSHNLQAVSSLCDRAVFLNRGVEMLGPTDQVLRTYVRAASERRSITSREGAVSILEALLLDEAGTPAPNVASGCALTLRVTYKANQDFDDFHFGFLAHRSTDSLVVYDETFNQADLGLRALRAGEVVTVDYRFKAQLTRGQYHLELHVYHSPTLTFPVRLSPAAFFTVEESRSYAGIANLGLRVLVRESPPVFEPTAVRMDRPEAHIC